MPSRSGARPQRTKYERRARTISVVMAGVLLLSIVGGAIGIVTQSGDAPTTTTRPPAAVDAEGEELLALLEDGAAATYQAGYVIGGEGDGSALLEVVRDGDRVREQLATPTADGNRVDLTIFDGDTAASCVQVGESAWTCTPPDPGRPRTDRLSLVVQRTDLLSADVVASDEQVGERDARCFSYTAAGVGTVLCLDADGIPLRITRGDAVIELASLDLSVDPAMFVPPAPVTGAP